MKQPVMKVKAMELKSVALCQTALQQMKQACASRKEVRLKMRIRKMGTSSRRGRTRRCEKKLHRVLSKKYNKPGSRDSKGTVYDKQ